MSGITVLEQLADLGVSLWVDGDRLKYRGPVGAVDELRDQVSTDRVILLELLQVGGLPGDVRAWPADDRELFEERAGVMEFDGGLGRAEAELLAEARVRLNAVRRRQPS